MTAPELAVPAYIWEYDFPDWNRLLEAQPKLIVINPASGPGDSADLRYTQLIAQFREQGTRVFGYVYTSYCNRPLPEVYDECERYRAWYDLRDIFFDEVNAVYNPSNMKYLQGCHGRVRSWSGWNQPKGSTIFNPGSQVHSDMWKRLDGSTWCTFEGMEAIYRRIVPMAHPLYHAREWHIIWLANETPQLHDMVVRSRVGLVYITSDGADGNPFDSFRKTLS
jgi:Spherulation-specific family 4